MLTVKGHIWMKLHLHDCNIDKLLGRGRRRTLSNCKQGIPDLRGAKKVLTGKRSESQMFTKQRRKLTVHAWGYELTRKILSVSPTLDREPFVLREIASHHIAAVCRADKGSYSIVVSVASMSIQRITYWQY